MAEGEVLLEQDIVTMADGVPKKITVKKEMGSDDMSRQMGLEGVPLLKVYADFASTQNIEDIWPKDFDAAIKSGEEKTMVRNLCGAYKPGDKDHWAAVYIVKGEPWKLVIEVQAPGEELVTMETEVPPEISDIKKAYAK